MSLEVRVLVKLKSGGPKMTVVDLAGDESGPWAGKVKCAWFQHNDPGYEVLESEWFPPTSPVILTGDDQIAP